MNEIIARFTSRKFLLALVGLASVFFGDKLHITPDQTDAIVTLIIAFTAAEGAADIATRFTNIPEVDEPKAKSKK